MYRIARSSTFHHVGKMFSRQKTIYISRPLSLSDLSPQAKQQPFEKNVMISIGIFSVTEQKIASFNDKSMCCATQKVEFKIT